MRDAKGHGSAPSYATGLRKFKDAVLAYRAQHPNATVMQIADNVKDIGSGGGYGSLATIDDVRAYLQNAIESFNGDPADSDYQHGYLGALIEVQKMIAGQ